MALKGLTKGIILCATYIFWMHWDASSVMLMHHILFYLKCFIIYKVSMAYHSGPDASHGHLKRQHTGAILDDRPLEKAKTP